jgi:phosphocarrier protein HPr
MVEMNIVVNNKTGLHARPADLFTKTAAKFQSKVTVRKGEKTVDAKSILKILSLGVRAGTELTIAADGSDEQQAVVALVELIESGLGE